MPSWFNRYRLFMDLSCHAAWTGVCDNLTYTLFNEAHHKGIKFHVLLQSKIY